MGQVIGTRWCSLVACATLVTALALVPSTPAKDKKQDKKAEKAAAEALLDKAAALTNIESAGSQPFVYIATANWTANGKTLKGQYGIAWQQVDRYRKQIASPGYLQTEVVLKDTLYRLRNFKSPPLVTTRWDGMFALRTLFTDWPEKKLKIYRSHLPEELRNFANFTCVVSQTSGGIESYERLACVDDLTGLPLLYRAKYGDNTITRAFFDYANLGDKNFPRDITYSDSTGARGELRATRLEILTAFAASTFQPESGSKAEPWCADPTFKNPMKNDPLFLFMQQQPTPFKGPDLDDAYAFVAITAKGRAEKVFFAGKPSNFVENNVANGLYSAQFLIKMCGQQAVPYETFVHLPVR